MGDRYRRGEGYDLRRRDERERERDRDRERDLKMRVAEEGGSPHIPPRGERSYRGGYDHNAPKVAMKSTKGDARGKGAMQPERESQRGGPPPGGMHTVSMAIKSRSDASSPQQPASPLVAPTKLAKPVVPSVKSCKFLNADFEFVADSRANLTDSTDFTVVGICGTPGSGKTTLANDLVKCLLQQSGAASDELLTSPEASPFPPSPGNESAKVVPYGIHMAAVTLGPSRIILLDTQGLLSPTVLYYLIQHDTALMQKDLRLTSAEHALEHLSLCLVILLLSCCNSVVYTIDGHHLLGASSGHHLNLLKTARSLQHLAPTVATVLSGVQLPGVGHSPHTAYLPLTMPSKWDGDEGGRGQESGDGPDSQGAEPTSFTADLFFTATSVNETSPLASSATMQQVESFLRDSYLDTTVDFQPAPPGAQLHLEGADGEEDMEGRDEEDEEPPQTAAAKSQQSVVHVLDLPSRDEGPEGGVLPDCKERYSTAVERLAEALLSPSKHAMFPKEHKMTEKEWATVARRIWQNILHQNGFISEYNKQLQKLYLFR
eukprot:Sspe_Gene.83106::Locus_54511_Transcript_1_1_Confidence_1.000_Length_1990::g.83106::m.83106/K18735/SMG9; protein SMG9